MMFSKTSVLWSSLPPFPNHYCCCFLLVASPDLFLFHVPQKQLLFLPHRLLLPLFSGEGVKKETSLFTAGGRGNENYYSHIGNQYHSF